MKCLYCDEEIFGEDFYTHAMCENKSLRNASERKWIVKPNELLPENQFRSVRDIDGVFSFIYRFERSDFPNTFEIGTYFYCNDEHLRMIREQGVTFKAEKGIMILPDGSMKPHTVTFS